jgi:hypothetical protein
MMGRAFGKQEKRNFFVQVFSLFIEGIEITASFGYNEIRAIHQIIHVI